MVNRPAVRALATGVVNTAFGFAVIAIALAFGAPSFAANALGYVAGWGLSFFLHRHFVFAASSQNFGNQAFRFFGAVAIAFGANLCALGAAENILGAQPIVAQLIAMATYTVCLFTICARFVFQKTERRISDDTKVRLATVCLAIISFVAIAGNRLTHDVVWQLWIARQMAHGAELYTDIIEVNPPLWFWMGLGIHKFATFLDVAPTLILKAFVLGYAATAVILTDSLNERSSLRSRLTIALSSFAIVALLPMYDFGQREQLALIATLPYAALINARSQKRELAWGKSVFIGLFTAGGMALKHYFVAVPILLEILLFIKLRTVYRPIRSETFTLFVCACGYAAAVILYSPEFLTDIVPLVNLAYDGYNSPLLMQFFDMHQLVIYSIIAALIVYRSVFIYSLQSISAYSWAAAGFAIAFFAQQKGWQYHAIPITGFLLILLVTCVNDAVRQGVRIRDVPVAVLAIAGAILTSAVWVGPYKSGAENFFRHTTNDLVAGDVVFTASTGPRISWPMVEEQGLVWPSRYFAMWPIGSIVLTPSSDPRHIELARLADLIRAQTYQDLACNPPKMILIENPLQSHRLREAKFNYINFLKKSQNIKNFLDNYGKTNSPRGADVYVLKQNAKLPEKPSNCRRIY